MIDLSIDISYLSKYFGITPVTPTVGKPEAERVDENNMMTIKTEDGQITVNKDLLTKLLQEPEKLAKILKLADPENRYLIIKELNEDDLDKLLPFLSSDQLMLGLQFFTTEGLGELMNKLPKEEMVNLLLVHFTMEDVVPFMQENEMDEFFKSSHLEKKDVLDYFQGMEYGKFQKLMTNQFGEEFENKTSKEYLQYIEDMDDNAFQQFLLNMQAPEKRDAISGLCKLNPDYYLEFENEVLSRPIINNLEKEEIVKTMGTLDPEFLVPMIEELPQDLIQVVATQIDPTEFAKILSSNFSDLIVEMLASG